MSAAQTKALLESGCLAEGKRREKEVIVDTYSCLPNGCFNSVITILFPAFQIASQAGVLMWPLLAKGTLVEVSLWWLLGKLLPSWWRILPPPSCLERRHSTQLWHHLATMRERPRNTQRRQPRHCWNGKSSPVSTSVFLLLVTDQPLFV